MSNIWKKDNKELKRMFVYTHQHLVGVESETPILIKLFECNITGKRKFKFYGDIWNNEYSIEFREEVKAWRNGHISTDEFCNIYLSKIEYFKDNSKFIINHDYYNSVENMAEQFIECLEYFNMQEYKQSVALILNTKGE